MPEASLSIHLRAMRSIVERCRFLTTRQTDISSRTDFAWWPKSYTPS